MEDLIKKVTTAAGITEEQAKKSIEAVSAYVKDRLPDSFKDQIDNLVNGGTLTEGMKTKMNAVAGEFRDKAEDVIADVKEKLSGMFSSKKEEEK
ncbi:MAG: hypothetical protein IPO83_06575 [Chitinophagaceae bacterium]|nr:hypothetical protein [Chitinophagaceae bacterium]